MIDTHCHIHEPDYELDADEALKEAELAGVDSVICVGTDAKSSRQAIEFASSRQLVWASVGLHPHEADKIDDLRELAKLATQPKVVAIGECGLDYYYDNSPREMQQEALKQQLEIAKQHDLPVIFHIRGKLDDSSDAYADFWKIYDEFSLPGVIHSFSAQAQQLHQGLDRGLFIGINGIATFLKPGPQAEAVGQIPLDRLVLETDAPLLTPAPFRGRINEPKYISTIAEYLANVRGETIEEIGEHTNANAKQLFGL